MISLQFQEVWNSPSFILLPGLLLSGVVFPLRVPSIGPRGLFSNYWNKIGILDIILLSSSSHRAISTDIPDPLSPPLSIVHCFQQVLRDTSRIGTELLYVGSSWSSCLCPSMWRGPQEYITYELVPASTAVSRMSGSSNFDSFRNGW